MTLAQTQVKAASTQIPESPYRGIEPFRFVDHHIFFARREEQTSLIRSITIYRSFLLYGASGSGKSSLVNAGLIPLLIEHSFQPERIRVQPRRDQEIILERIPVTEDASGPFLPSVFDEGSNAPRHVLSTAEFEHTLRNTPNRGVLLIFDQFEEFVSLFQEAHQYAGTEDATNAQSAVARVVFDLITESAVAIKLLFVFREDYLSKLTQFFATCPNTTDHYFRLVPPGLGALEDIVRGPFKTFPGHFSRELPEAITGGMRVALEERPGPKVIDLSEIQIACLKLWEADDPKTQLRQKGLQGLLEEYLAESLQRLPANVSDAAVAILSHLVTSSGLRNVVSKEDLLAQLESQERIDPALAERALQALEDNKKLVRRERRQDLVAYEIVSEFLVPWIRRQRVERRARAERSRKLKRYRNIAIGALIAGVLMLVVAALWASQRTQQTLAQRVIQNAQADAAQARQERDNVAAALNTATKTRDAVQLTLNQKTTQAEADLDRLRKDLETAQKAAAEKEGTLTTLKARIDDINRSMSELKSQNTFLQQERARLSGIESQNTANAQKVKESLLQVEELQKQIANANPSPVGSPVEPNPRPIEGGNSDKTVAPATNKDLVLQVPEGKAVPVNLPSIQHLYAYASPAEALFGYLFPWVGGEPQFTSFKQFLKRAAPLCEWKRGKVRTCTLYDQKFVVTHTFDRTTKTATLRISPAPPTPAPNH